MKKYNHYTLFLKSQFTIMKFEKVRKLMKNRSEERRKLKEKPLIYKYKKPPRKKKKKVIYCRNEEGRKREIEGNEKIRVLWRRI